MTRSCMSLRSATDSATSTAASVPRCNAAVMLRFTIGTILSGVVCVCVPNLPFTTMYTWAPWRAEESTCSTLANSGAMNSGEVVPPSTCISSYVLPDAAT